MKSGIVGITGVEPMKPDNKELRCVDLNHRAIAASIGDAVPAQLRFFALVRRPILAVLFLFSWFGAAFAASTPDPCASLNFHQSAAVSMNSATTTAIVTLNANHGIFVCSFAITIAGASPATTAGFEYGTGSNCASNVTALTGTFGSNDAAASTTPTQVTYGDGGHTIFSVPPGSGLCVVTTGAGSFVQGAVTYVQSTAVGTFP
jgi:hypothetical protein